MLVRMDDATPAAAIRSALGLEPHPEGGAYRETWRDAPADGSRGAATSILFLLAADERSAWHRVDATELWLWQGGGALTLRVVGPDGALATHRLGPDIAGGEVLQAVVPAGCWQDAAPARGAWVLAGCVVAPAFEFAGFALAEPGSGLPPPAP
jgi:uncharacterized protein